MKTNAAVMWTSPGNFEISELELDPPKEGEVLVRYEYAGLCHSDEHMRHGDLRFDPDPERARNRVDPRLVGELAEREHRRQDECQREAGHRRD